MQTNLQPKKTRLNIQIPSELKGKLSQLVAFQGKKVFTLVRESIEEKLEQIDKEIFEERMKCAYRELSQENPAVSKDFKYVDDASENSLRLVECPSIYIKGEFVQFTQCSFKQKRDRFPPPAIPQSAFRMLQSKIPGPDLMLRKELCIRRFLAVRASSVDPNRSHQGRPNSKDRVSAVQVFQSKFRNPKSKFESSCSLKGLKSS